MGTSLLKRAMERVGGVDALLKAIPEEFHEALRYDWPSIARPEQLTPPGSWRTWLLLAGRGFGKSRCGSEFIRAEVEAGRMGRIALIGPTAADARDVMVEGESGVLSCSPPWFKPRYEPSKRRLTWPNGAMATLFSADQPDRLRGPQHDGFWCDEIAAWAYPETWDQMQFGLRLGRHPRGVATTTPRPIPLVKDLVKDPSTAVTRGSTFDNAENLAPGFLAHIRKIYEGTRLGRQEINAEILEDNPGALWKLAMIDALRVKIAPQLRRIVVGVDPAVSSSAESDETGIISAGIGKCRCKGEPEDHGFILDDESGIYTPSKWGERAISVYNSRKADRMVAETNNGGDLVESNIRACNGQQVAYKGIHAKKAKHLRAEPVAGLYEQRKIHHVGSFAKLEDQMTQWDPSIDSDSPDRLDAAVYALTELMLGYGAAEYRGSSDSVAKRRI